MLTIVRYSNGRRAEAIVLTANDAYMRLVLRGTDETAEFVHINGHWFSESGDCLEIESMIFVSETCLQSEAFAA